MLIGIGIAVYNTYRSVYDEWLDYILSSIMGLMGTGIGILIAIILPGDTYEKQSILKIGSLQDGNSASGSFFLGCGQIDGKMKYVFYHEENELFIMEQVDYNLVKIKEGSTHSSVQAPQWWQPINLTENATVLKSTPNYCQIILDRMLKLDSNLEIKKNGEICVKQKENSNAI